jgi:hypothetical protein
MRATISRLPKALVLRSTARTATAVDGGELFDSTN